MTEQTSSPTPRPRRRQLYVHRFQRVYAVKLGGFLFGYCLMVFGLAFILPSVKPAFDLLSENSVEARASAGTQVLSLTQNLWPTLLEIGTSMWPALLALILAAGFFSVYLTHRVAGPLYRFQRSTADLAQGDLGMRIHLREGDELQDLAEVANQAIANLDGAMKEIRTQTGKVKTVLEAALETSRARAGADPAQVSQLESALRENERIEDVLKRFRCSDSPRPPHPETA